MQRGDVTPAGELQERAKCRQPRIATAHRVASLVLQVVEERQDQLRRDVVQPDRRGLLVQLFSRFFAKSRNNTNASR